MTRFVLVFVVAATVIGCSRSPAENAAQQLPNAQESTGATSAVVKKDGSNEVLNQLPKENKFLK